MFFLNEFFPKLKNNNPYRQSVCFFYVQQLRREGLGQSGYIMFIIYICNLYDLNIIILKPKTIPLLLE